MTNHMEFVAEIKPEGHVHMVYKGKSTRHSKIRIQIIKDLKKLYQIEPQNVGNVYLKPYKVK